MQKEEFIKVWETNSNNNKEIKPTHRPQNPQHIRESRGAGNLGEPKGTQISGSKSVSPRKESLWLHPALKSRGHSP